MDTLTRDHSSYMCVASAGICRAPHKGTYMGPLRHQCLVGCGPETPSSPSVHQLHLPTTNNGLMLALGVLKGVLTVAAVEVVLAPGTVR